MTTDRSRCRLLLRNTRAIVAALLLIEPAFAGDTQTKLPWATGRSIDAILIAQAPAPAPPSNTQRPAAKLEPLFEDSDPPGSPVDRKSPWRGFVRAELAYTYSEP